MLPSCGVATLGSKATSLTLRRSLITTSSQAPPRSPATARRRRRDSSITLSPTKSDHRRSLSVSRFETDPVIGKRGSLSNIFASPCRQLVQDDRRGSLSNISHQKVLTNIQHETNKLQSRQGSMSNLFQGQSETAKLTGQQPKCDYSEWGSLSSIFTCENVHQNNCVSNCQSEEDFNKGWRGSLSNILSSQNLMPNTRSEGDLEPRSRIANHWNSNKTQTQPRTGNGIARGSSLLNVHCTAGAIDNTSSYSSSSPHYKSLRSKCVMENFRGSVDNLSLSDCGKSSMNLADVEKRTFTARSQGEMKGPILLKRRRSKVESSLMFRPSTNLYEEVPPIRRFSSMSNVNHHQDEEKVHQEDHTKYGLAIGAAATATAAAIALLMADTLHASEMSDVVENNEDFAELNKKCRISKEIDQKKMASQKGSFILQDLMTNTLYLIAQAKNDPESSSEGEESSDATQSQLSNLNFDLNQTDDVTQPQSQSLHNELDDVTQSQLPNSHNNNEGTQNLESSQNGELTSQSQFEDSNQSEDLSSNLVQISDTNDVKTSSSSTSIESTDENENETFLFVRRGSGRALNASTMSTSLLPKSRKSKTASDSDDESETDDSSNDETEDDKNSKKGNGKNGSKKERLGFRDRKIVDYENRIRAYSTPDKIFRYFATYKSTQDSEIFMTPEDFLRSLTPGVKQPDGLGLDQFKKFDPQTMNVKNLDQNLPEDSIFFRLGSSGFISFSDYVFMLTILSTSRRQFEIAFRMFDLNGDGDVDAEEFEQVQNIIRQTTTVGSRHRDHSNTGNTLKGINSALAVYFFGENLDGKLTIDRFLDFQEELQRAILTLEFQRKDPDDDGLITEKQFAELILTYADYSPKKRTTVLKRVKKTYKEKKSNGDDNGETDFDPSKEVTLGINLEDYIQIFAVLIHIDDVDKALSFYNLAGASIDKMTLKHVAKVCAGVDLRDHLVNVLFTIFDEDGDGVLSNREFVSVMKNKLKRGLEKPKDIGIVNLFSAVAKCAKSTPIPAAPTLVFTPH